MNGLTRRACLTSLALGLPIGRSARASLAPSISLGILQFGTVQWVADVIRRHALDAENGFSLTTILLANTDAGRVSLMADAANVAVLDWMFVAAQRSAGTRLCFAPFSSSTGGIMAAQSAPIHALSDLAHRKLGVAGGPVDKSWLIVRAAAKATSGIDLAEAANVIYGAPPLLSAKLAQGELDAVLTYWNFAARLEAAGFRQITSVDDCARSLGLPVSMSLVGFAFHERWANRDRAAMNGFLDAVATAETLLASSPIEWQRIRPLMNAPDDAMFDRLKQRFIKGMTHPSVESQERAAARLFDVLLRTGGTQATAGMTQLPPGIFWAAPPGG